MLKLEFSLSVLSVTKILTWKCHVDESTTGRYGMIIGRDLLTKLGIHLKFSTNAIECDKGPYQGCKTTMVKLYAYDFKPTNINMRIFLEYSRLNAYVNECHELEPISTETKRVWTILDNNYENEDLHKQ